MSAMTLALLAVFVGAWLVMLSFVMSVPGDSARMEAQATVTRAIGAGSVLIGGLYLVIGHLS